MLLSVFRSVYYGSDRVPGVVIATDVICRFPTETAHDEVGQCCSAHLLTLAADGLGSHSSAIQRLQVPSLFKEN